MFLLLAALAVLPQARPSERPRASIAGVVVHGATGAPLADVRVSLARTDAAPAAFVQMIAGDRPPAEFTITGDLLAGMAEEMSLRAGDPNVPPQVAAEMAAFSAWDTKDIGGVIIDPSGNPAIIPKSAPPVLTDSQGRFAFRNVEPGTYRLMFARNGYVKQDYGQRFAGGSGTPIVLGPGQSKTDIVMRMTQTAAIGGRVVDAAGRPIAEVPVQLSRFVYDETGQRKMQSVSVARTNDLGEYRMYYLSPGRYYLHAGHAPGQLQIDATLEARIFDDQLDVFGLPRPNPNRIPEQYAIAYYPGAPDVSAAETIDLQPGADLDGTDFVLSAQRYYRVRGRVVDPTTGQPPPSANVLLTPQDPGPLGELDRVIRRFFTHAFYNPSDGTFELRDVSAGAYNITVELPIRRPPAPNQASMSPAEQAAFFEAMQFAESASPRASASIHVVNADIDGLTLTVGVGTSISGRVRGDRPDSGAPELPFLRILLRPAVGPSTDSVIAPQPRPPKADGAFRIDNVWPGEYRVSAAGLPPGFYLKEARLGEVDVLNNVFSVSAGPGPGVLDIVISANGGVVEGAAVGPGGRPVPGAEVVLIPERSRTRTDLFRTTVADTAGRFTISGVAPGDYRLVAWEAIEPYGFFDPNLAQQVDEHGKPIRVAESSRQSVDVTPIPVP